MITFVVRLADLEFLATRDLSGEPFAVGILRVVRRQARHQRGSVQMAVRVSNGGARRIASERGAGMDLNEPFHPEMVHD